MRRRPVHALIDLLAHRRVKAVIALGKAGDPQVALDPRKIRYGDSRDVQFRRLTPTDAPRNRRIVDAIENPVRVVPRKRIVNPGDAVAVGAETAHLGEMPDATNPLVVRKGRPRPIASRIVAGEYVDLAAKVPGGGQ